MSRLIKAPATAPPFQVDAIILEEDTGLVLSADTRIKDTQEHPIRLMTDLISAEVHQVGTAVFMKGRPHRIFAIVHDMDRTPHCCKEWVCSALEQCLKLCAQQEIESVAVQKLGCVHGKLDASWFEFQLQKVSATSELKQIWLID